jgi:hypothetical protein
LVQELGMGSKGRLETRPFAALGLGIGVLAVAGCLAGPARGDTSPDRDLLMALEGRQRLLQDNQLARYNLGVTVKGRVATLWGTVPSAALGRWAVDLMRAVPGVLAIRSDIRVEPGEEAALPPNAARRPHTPDRRAPGSLAGNSSAVAPSRLTSERAKNAGPGKGSEAAEVLPAIVVPTPPGPPVPSAIRPSDGSPAKLEEAVRQVQRRDPRFGGIQLEVRQGVVFLRGPASRADDLYRLAQTVADLPGVGRVVVRELPAAANR